MLTFGESFANIPLNARSLARLGHDQPDVTESMKETKAYQDTEGFPRPVSEEFTSPGMGTEEFTGVCGGGTLIRFGGLGAMGGIDDTSWPGVC